MPQQIEVPGMGVVEFPDGMTDAQISSAIRANLRLPVNQTADIAKSAGIGLAKAGTGLLGLPGDIGSLVSAGAEKLGVPEDVRSNFGKLASVMPGLRPFVGPGSQEVQKQVESLTGEFYKPKTAAGEFAQTAGELAPMLLGPGGLARKGIQLAGATLGSEGAGRAAQEIAPAAEPYARVAGAVLGGVPFAGKTATTTSQGLIDKVLKSSEQGYKSSEVGSVIFKPTVIDNLSNSIAGQLKRAKANEKLAPQTHALVEDLKQPVNGIWHSYEDLQTTRELLGKQAGNFNNPQEQRAATIALKSLTNYIDHLPQSHLASGDAQKASEILMAARGNYAAGKTAEKVAEKLANAEVQAGSTYSGGNINNATRQKLRPLLTSKKQGRGLTEDELASIEQAVIGTPTGNFLRGTGKLLGGGGGLQTLGAGTAGSALAGALGGGPFGMVAGAVVPPAIGYAARKAGDALTRRHSDQIVRQILDRSPLGLSPNSPLKTLKSAPPWLQQAILSSLLMRPQLALPQPSERVQ